MKSFLLLCLVGAAFSLNCFDERGMKTDWHILLKAPAISSSSNPNVSQGTGFAYMDPGSNLHLAYNDITSDNNAVAITLSALYGGDTSSLGWVMYNDEDPVSGQTCFDTACGHTKGVLGFDATGAFWLLHSVPKFPPGPQQGYSYPHSGQMYGQSFLCVSLSFDQVEQVAHQLRYSQPHIYSSNIPSNLASQLPTLAAVINGDHETSPSTSAMSLPSVGGVNFTSLAKTAQWGKSIYEDLVAPTYNANLYIETWMRPKLASFCTPQYQYNVMDINSITLPGGVSFTEYHDHSKWAMSADSGTPLVCIGGVNHQTTQFTRSGGTMCFLNSRVYKAFANIVTDADSC